MKKKVVDYSDLIAGLIVIGISIIGYISTLGTKSFATTVGVSSTDIPRGCCYIMFALGIGIALKFLIPFFRHNPPMKEVEDVDSPEETPEEKKKVLYQKITTPVTLGLIFIYIFLMDKIGFTISTMIYLMGQITLLSMDTDKKSLTKYAVISVAAAVVIYFLFAKAFNMMLPVNKWGF